LSAPAQAPAGWDAVIRAPGFSLGVRVEGTAVCAIEFLPKDAQPASARPGVAERACAQIEAYLRDPDASFDLPLKSAGTRFQRKVWKAIREIPRGRTATYGELARKLGSAPLAVGQACGANPFPLVVPCHRVVGSDGIGGFAHARDGSALAIKRWLLQHEGAY
jgi:methylated-DNA-[protein]-cysteine S-methyltransferase